MAAAMVALGAQAQSLPTTGVTAVPTYESVGLYWTGSGANAATGCNVSYRRVGDSAWSTGMALWYDSRSAECRGSLVGLTPGTNYEAQLGVAGGAFTRGVLFTTWTNRPAVARTVSVPGGGGTYNVAEGGGPAGYVVYDGGGAVRDAANGAQFNITINASYVIVRNFVLRGAQQDAIRISPNVRDVIIEDNDISGWGRTRDGKWGADMDSAVRAICSSETLTRVTIQRNRMYNPRYPANSWSDGHPAGPQAISFSYCAGNHVFRWNEVYSTNGNKFNDAFGGEDNFTTTGFPNSDSDIYGNKISHAWDDAIEAEGANKNVRIWGNYIDRTAIGIATTLTSVGPVYIFRNVFNRSQFYQGRSNDADSHEVFLKSGSHPDFSNGRRYVLHNTMLQAMDAGQANGGGGGAGIGGTGDSQPVRNTVSMNNIYHTWKTGTATYQVGGDNQFQRDMFNGNLGTAVVSGLNATPQYAPGNGWQSEANGLYQLAAGTPGHDAAVRIPNFNDGFVGAGPDVGAAESGASAMKFGIAASTAGTGGTATSIPTPPPATPTPPPATPTPPPSTPTTPVGTGGTASPSLGLDASAYSLAAGQSVTITARITGNAGTPTGTVNFRANGSTIANCGAAALSSGVATCTTTSLSGGANVIIGVYSGSSVYSTGQAGPITLTVSGTATTAPATLPTRFGIDSSAYSSAVGQAVTFTATIPGDGGSVSFSANNAAIAGCGAIAVSRGYASCTTAALPAGSHGIRATYSGNGSYGAGLAGPITQTVSGTTTVASGFNVQGLWWGSESESGWGVNLTQQGDIVFATWFTYDANGRGQWLVMSRGDRTGPNSFSGALHRTTGPSFKEASFDPNRVQASAVGNATFTFTDANHGVFTAVVNGVTVTKAITRQVFDAAVPTCTAGGSSGAAPNYQDLWWRTGGVESGWGVNVTHQGDILFITWFTYDTDGSQLWLVGSKVVKTANGRYEGRLYRTTGPAFNSAQWNPAAVGATDVGAVSITFNDATNGTFSYNVDGVAQSKPITRQVFSTPATVCR